MSVSPCETKGGPKIQGFIILFHFLAISEVSAFPDLEAKINHGKALDFGGEPGDSTYSFASSHKKLVHVEVDFPLLDIGKM